MSASLAPAVLALARASAPHRDPDQIAKSVAARKLLHDQSVAIAARLEARGVSVYREATMTTINDDGTAETVRCFRDIHILPEVASRGRRELRLALSLFFERHKRCAKYSRYYVLTGGERVPIGQIAERKATMERAIGHWGEYAERFGIDLVFVSWEDPIAVDGTAHVHANLVVYPRRMLTKSDAKAAMAKLRELIGGHVRDNGRVGSVKELVKYITKPEEVIALSDDHLVELAEELRGMKLCSPLGPFKRWRQAYKAAGKRISSCRGRPVFVDKQSRGEAQNSEGDEDAEPAENLVVGLASRFDEDGQVQVRVRALNYTAEPKTRRGKVGLCRIASLRDQARWIATEARALEAADHGEDRVAAASAAVIKATWLAAGRYGRDLDRLLAAALLCPHLPNKSRASAMGRGAMGAMEGALPASSYPEPVLEPAF